MDNVEIKLNDNNEIVKVITSTSVQETVISTDELERQIAIYQEVLDKLTAQLAEVQALEVAVAEAVVAEPEVAAEPVSE